MRLRLPATKATSAPSVTTAELKQRQSAATRKNNDSKNNRSSHTHTSACHSCRTMLLMKGLHECDKAIHCLVCKCVVKADPYATKSRMPLKLHHAVCSCLLSELLLKLCLLHL
mmetsp:Transcript_85755/g.170229  ORF Transcript_85755/g.170229 Transcript_85755/m.170229 type:complete len:113 (+) Transcript_85755:101-439(+)